MNKIATLLLFLAMGLTAFSQNAPKMKFTDSLQYDMGTFKEGEVAQHTFEFKNVGDAPLKIKEIKTTCSCTASEWPKQNILPGESSSIKVSFDTHGKLGTYDKGVNIYSNAGETNIIITVTVVESGEPAKKEHHHETGGHEGHNHD